MMRALTLWVVGGVFAACATPKTSQPLWADRGAELREAGTQQTLTFDGQKHGPYDGIADPTLSPDGHHLAFIAEEEGRRTVHWDGKASRAYEHVQAHTLRFSADSAHLVFVGADDACARIVRDLEESPCHERVVGLAVDEAGRTAAVVRDGSRERVVFQPDEQRQEPADSIAELRLQSGHFAYAARHGSRWTAVVDGRAAAECARIRHLRLGDHGRRAAYVCGDNGAAAIVLDGEQLRAWPQVSAPQLRDDSPAFAYVAHDREGAWVLTDDSTWGPFGEVTDLALGPSSVTFVTRSHGATTVVHREQRIELPAVVDGSLTLSDDGEHWALISADVETRTFWLTVDGKRVHSVDGKDVFGGKQLTPWVRR